MTENKNAPFSAEAFSDFLSKNGISTVMLIAVSYVAWNSFLKPASERHIALLDSVSETNKSLAVAVEDLRSGLRDVGEKNEKTLEKNEGNIEEIIRKVDALTDLSRAIDSKLDVMRGSSSRFIPPPSPTGDTTD